MMNVIKYVKANAILSAFHKSQAIIEFNVDGIIIDANELFLQAMGYTLDEIKGKHHSMFVKPDDAKSDAYRTFWQNLRAGQFQSGEFQRVGKGNTDVWIQASYNPIVDGSGTPYRIVKIASDITAAKQKSTMDAGMIAAINRAQAVIAFTPDGTILDANSNFLKTTGYTLAEIQGQHHRMFMPQQQAQSPEYKQFWARLSAGEYIAGEFCRIDKHGREIWIQASYNPIFDINGTPCKVVKYATDITAEKLRNADYQGQIEAISKSQAIIEFDLDGTIRTANENFLQTLGYSLQDIQGKHHSIFVDSNEVQSPKYAEFWDVLRSGRFHSGQFRRMGKGGREVWIQASYNPICDANGAPFKVVKYATDITPQIMARIEAEERGATASADIQTVAAATEEMLASVNEISSSMARTQASVSDIINKNAEAKIHTDQLQENTKSMESIVALIRDISEQVNLLALNATIEAARAGDAGKGFAVVAGEVKMLANETAKATDQIAQKISSIQSISNDVVHSGTTIADAVNTVGANTGTIAAAIEEQTATSHEISSKMQSLSIAVDELSQCIQTIAK